MSSTPPPGPVQRVLLVVPAWQEEAVIAGTLAAIAAAIPWADVLVVDDGSADRTAEIAAGAGAIVARMPFNVGVGGAMRAGFLYAARHDYDVVVQVDADGQHDPAEITRLIAALEAADIVIGSRFAGAGSYRVRGPRRWAMSLLARVLSGLTGVRLNDVTSGFRASGPRAVRIFAREYPAEYLGDTVESLVVAHRVGLVVTQVPVVMRPRQGGVPSHSPAKSAIYLFRALLVLLLALMRRGSTQAAHEGE